MSLAKIKEYAFEVPLLFEGDRGSGKTYDIRSFARSEGLPYLEIAGNESLEAFDFLGHVMQTEHGLVWKDGKLSQAFRLASGGVRVVLLIDEMLRVPQRHLSVLLSALSPDMDGNYRLQTGRMSSVANGIGVEEEIIAPRHMISIFATTNVGPEFAIDELDPAVAERFIILRKDTEQSQLVQILKDKAIAKGFSTVVALKLAEFFNKTQRMVKTGSLNRHATTRTLSRAIEVAKTEAGVKEVLRDQILLWVDRDSTGRPVAEQVTLLSQTIDELFVNMERHKELRDERAFIRARAALGSTLAAVATHKRECADFALMEESFDDACGSDESEENISELDFDPFEEPISTPRRPAGTVGPETRREAERAETLMEVLARIESIRMEQARHREAAITWRRVEPEDDEHPF